VSGANDDDEENWFLRSQKAIKEERDLPNITTCTQKNSLPKRLMCAKYLE
jgi:hypothetical protein